MLWKESWRRDRRKADVPRLISKNRPCSFMSFLGSQSMHMHIFLFIIILSIIVVSLPVAPPLIPKNALTGRETVTAVIR